MYGAYIGGIFPRSEKLIEATRLKAPNLLDLFREEKKKVIALQRDARLSYLADPMEDSNSRVFKKAHSRDSTRTILSIDSPS